jgi:Flp pilus assembly protein TadD
MNSPAITGLDFEGLGDEEVYLGDLSAAKRGYGRAIDIYLAERNYGAAIRTCRKLIRLAPDVVRTRFTLAYLLVGQGHFEEATVAVKEYEAAVRLSGTDSYAWPLLTLLA